MKLVCKFIQYIFIKIIMSFYNVFNGIIHIKDDLTEKLAQIFSNLTTCVFTIISIALVVRFYIKNGISTQFNMSMNESYYNDLMTAIFFITVVLGVIFIFVKHFANGEKKEIIASIVSLVICLIPAICAIYMLLVQEGIIHGSETTANLITFNDRQNGIKYFCIYSAISVVTLLISLAITKQWENIIDIIFGCIMYIIILPILLMIASNIIAIIAAIVSGVILSFVFGVSIFEFFEVAEEQMNEYESEKRKNKMAKKFIEKKQFWN